MSDVDSKTQMI